MANTIRCRFTKPFGAFKVGQVLKLDPAKASSLAEYVQVLDDVPTVDAEDGLDGAIVESLRRANENLRAMLSRSDNQLDAAKARIVELDQLVSDYAEGNPVESNAEELAALRDENERLQAALDMVSRRIGAMLDDKPAPAPVVSEPVVESEPGAAWRSQAVASLGIPSGLKSALVRGGMTTAGEAWDGLDDGSVLALDGVGDVKADDLRAFLESIN